MLKNLKEDKTIGNWFSTMKVSTGTAYRNGVIKFCNYTKKTPEQLIKEARQDYINRVPPWELKHIAQLEGFTNMLKGYDAANNSKLTWIQGVKSFYAFHKLPIAGFKTSIPQISKEEYLDLPILKIEDIRKAVLDCGTNKKLKAMILIFLSSGQGQAEVRKLQGRHLKNRVNGVAIVNMTRGKTKRRYTFFIGAEALNAIKEFKPDLKDDEFIFTQKNGSQHKPQEIDGFIYRHCDKIGLNRSYFAPHRFRHYFKSTLTGSMDGTFIEYLVGHRLPGVQGNYFLGNQEKMLEQYIKNQDKLTVFTDHEVLQMQYDEIKTQKGTDGMQEQINRLERAVFDARSDMLRIVREELGLTHEQIPDQLKIRAMIIE